MPVYRVYYHAATRTATVNLPDDPAVSGGAVLIGTFNHDNEDDGLGDNPTEGGTENHVIWHHVRDLLYKRSAANPANTAMFPDNITDLDRIKIVFDNQINVVSISMTPATATITVADPTVQLAIAFTPTTATNKKVTYVSSDPTKATVSETGLVTRVANGSTTITATTEDGAKTDTTVITVTD